jgi:hypothetical protein
MIKVAVLMLVLTVIIIFLGVACNLEVNTSDSQASISIAAAKKDHFFIAEYNKSPVLPKIFSISEAWVESVWFNKILNGKAVKEKSNTFQLNMKLTGFSNPNFYDDKYILTWDMKDDRGNGIGKGNGVYILPLKSGPIPDSFNIVVYEMKSDTGLFKMTQFALFRKR